MEVFSLIVLALGAVAMAGVIYGLRVRPQRIAQRWPVVPGTIISSKVKSRWLSDTSTSSDGSSSSGRYFRANVVFEYHVAGKRYQGNRIGRQQGFWFGFQRSARRLADRYPKGGKVDVHCDSADPRRAIVDPSVSVDIWIALVTCVVVSALLFGVGVVRGLRAW